MPLQDTIRAALDRVTTAMAQTYAETHPWFTIDEDGGVVYNTPLFDELDDILAELGREELAEGILTPQKTFSAESHDMKIQTREADEPEIGIAFDCSPSMERYDDALSQAQNGSVLIDYEKN